MKNISIRIITAIGAVFSKLNFFSKMNKCKNIVKLIICAFAFVGLTACGGGGGGGSSTPTDGGNDPVNITDRVNQDSLSNYTLQNLGESFINEISQKIDDNSATVITVSISNNDSNDSTSKPIDISGDSWKTTPIDISSLVGNEDGDKNLTISITYINQGVTVGTETTITRTIFYDNTAPSIESFTDINTLLPITGKASFTFTLTFDDSINTSTFAADDDFIIDPSNLIDITKIDFNGSIATITATTNIPTDQTGDLTISVGENWTDLADNTATTDQLLYTIDVQLPTVTATDSQPNENTETTNDYIITYTFSEQIEGIKASDFAITTGTGTIADDITHDMNTVMLSVTSTEESIEITVTNFIDINKNLGNEDAATFNLGNIAVDIVINDTANQNSLENYTLQNLGESFINEISQKIDDNSATVITVSISNNDSNDSTSKPINISGDSWKTTPIDISSLVGNEDGDKNLTISITYINQGVTVGTETTATLNISYDGTAPSIVDFTDEDFLLPITNKASFIFTITFSENINADTFTAADILLTPAGLVTITDSDIDFNDTNTVATITAFEALATATGNLTITVGTNYEDLAGNNPDGNKPLYDIDVERPTVSFTDSAPNGNTEATNDYIITYTFSENVAGISSDNFKITNGIGTIASDIIYANNTVMLAVTSTEESIEITVTNFTDINKNVGNEDTVTFILGDITVPTNQQYNWRR